jgi:hypothetical protein
MILRAASEANADTGKAGAFAAASTLPARIKGCPFPTSSTSGARVTLIRALYEWRVTRSGLLYAGCDCSHFKLQD